MQFDEKKYNTSKDGLLTNSIPLDESVKARYDVNRSQSSVRVFSVLNSLSSYSKTIEC